MVNLWSHPDNPPGQEWDEINVQSNLYTPPFMKKKWGSTMPYSKSERLDEINYILNLRNPDYWKPPSTDIVKRGLPESEFSFNEPIEERELDKISFPPKVRPPRTSFMQGIKGVAGKIGDKFKSEPLPEGYEGEIERSLRAQRGIEYADIALHAGNLMREMGRTREPLTFKSPVISYTPTESSLALDLKRGEDVTNRERALMLRSAEEHGNLGLSPHIMSTSDRHMQQYASNAMDREMKRRTIDAARGDEARTKQSMLDQEATSKNIQEQFKRNMISGRVMGDESMGIINTLTRMNEQRLAGAKMKDMLEQYEDQQLPLYFANMYGNYGFDNIFNIKNPYQNSYYNTQQQKPM